MKINRLIETMVLLLNRKVVTAKELADRFEVSRRTIYRDIEVLSTAGIPVYMSKGKGGGISLLEEFSVNKAFLSQGEKESLIMALKTLQATQYPEANTILEKIKTIFKEPLDDEWVEVDFSEWGSSQYENHKFELIKKSILKNRVISFCYINTLGEKTHRMAEPMKLIYKARAWYLYAYCRLKNDFRVFRISRITSLVVSDEIFQRRAAASSKVFEINNYKSKLVTLNLRFKKEAAYRVYDDFDEKSITKNSDGTFGVAVTFPEDEWVYGYLLSFGNYVEVIGPDHVREKILKKLLESIKIYT